MIINGSDFYDGIPLRNLHPLFPNCKTFEEIMYEVKSFFEKDESLTLSIEKKSKWSFDFSIVRKLAIYAKFNVNARTKTVKRII